MKKLKYFMTLFAVAALFGGMSSVCAADGTITSSTANHEFTIKRTVTGVTNKVTNTFTYTITADSSNPAVAGGSGVPASATVAFSNVTPNASNEAVAQGTINLTGATFSKPGDYSYVVTETASTNATTYPVDSTNKYTIKVSVRNGSNVTDPKTVVINGFEGEGQDATKIDGEGSGGSGQGGSGQGGSGQGGAQVSGSLFEFTKAAVFTNITWTKTVEGSMADANEYFKVKVTINGGSGETYVISGQTKSGASTTYTVGQDNYIYLKHGETVTIGTSSSLKQVPIGVTYSFVEQDATDYETYINGNTTNSKSSSNITTTASTGANTIVNKWDDQSVVTGVIMKTLPYVIIAAIAIAAIIFIIVKKKNKKEEEVTE